MFISLALNRLSSNGWFHEENDFSNGSTPLEDLDVAIVGADFAGWYLLYQLRRWGFKVKVIEAGSDLGGVWYWNTYPGARVDSQYPIYAYYLPEIYEDWNWISHYPDHVEMRQYFAHVDTKLYIKKDTIFNNKVVLAQFDEKSNKWNLTCDTGRIIRVIYFIVYLGFATKRYFPDWDKLDSFKGVIYHSFFWPKEDVDVQGKKCAVVGTGATGIQITQEWAKGIGDKDNLKMFQCTPNMACAMQQRFLISEQVKEDRKKYPEIFQERLTTYNGFMYQARLEKIFDYSSEERQELFEKL